MHIKLFNNGFYAILQIRLQNYNKNLEYTRIFTRKCKFIYILYPKSRSYPSICCPIPRPSHDHYGHLRPVFFVCSVPRGIPRFSFFCSAMENCLDLAIRTGGAAGSDAPTQTLIRHLRSLFPGIRCRLSLRPLSGILCRHLRVTG